LKLAAAVAAGADRNRGHRSRLQYLSIPPAKVSELELRAQAESCVSTRL
jgi:hypothetical protein